MNRAERSNGDVTAATNLAIGGVRVAIAKAHSLGRTLSVAFDAYKDFLYMWKAWKLLVYR